MKKGFTLVELLIVIIIIGILATMAMPQYQKMVNRAKWAEAMQLASAIKTAQSLYYAEYNSVYSTNNLTDLNTLDLPAVTARKFAFSIHTTNYIYAEYEGDDGVPADNFATPPAAGTAYFCINLTANTTAYGNGAPGELE